MTPSPTQLVSPLRVAKSLVVFLVATLRWLPVRCAAGLVFLQGAEDRHLGVLKVVFCQQAQAWTRVS